MGGIKCRSAHNTYLHELYSNKKNKLREIFRFSISCLQVEVDARSVYVGNVDYGATAEELEQHFHGCGSINRVTILCNKYDGNPKGFAYVEFTDKESVDTAMALDDSLFRYLK